jgi:hypothetical protein
MIKLLFYLGTGLAAFCIGILPGCLDLFSQPVYRTPRIERAVSDVSNVPYEHFRSCQVKQVKTNGRVVWMSCVEWRRAEKQDF